MTAPVRNAGIWFSAIALICIAAVGAALVSQHVFNMQPCPWCVLQRLILLSIAAVCLLAAVLGGPGRRVGGAAVVLLALSGVAAALWQHFKAASSVSCNLTLADKILSGLQLDRLLPDVFEPRASCADAAVNLLGVPYDFWSLALFVLVMLAAARLMGRR